MTVKEDKEDKEAKAGWVGKKPAKPAKPAKVKATFVLDFPSAGWCAKLECSYRRGRYTAKSKEDYDALKPYAKKGK